MQEPITWTWRDLCRRMRVSCGGQMVQLLKDAITSTAALLIQSEYALYSKPDGRLLCTQQEALHLYDRVAFVGGPLPGGGICDSNYLWFSEWYRKNLNAMFTAPLDYDLWRFLDEKSPIASRLYEFLLLNFYSATPLLRINYANLVQFLPIHAERYRSSAKRQLQSALGLLTATHVIASAEWADGKDATGLLHFYRGDRLPTAASRGAPTLPFMEEESTGIVEVRELRNVKPPEWTLIADFYRLWSGDTAHRPTPKELCQASDLIKQHGIAKAKAVLPLLVKRMKVEWPDAKTFGATAVYVPDALRDLQRVEHARQTEERELQEEEADRRKLAREANDRAVWQGVWDELPADDRENIRKQVLAGQPRSLSKRPALVERLCLNELARQRGGNDRQ